MASWKLALASSAALVMASASARAQVLEHRPVEKVVVVNADESPVLVTSRIEYRYVGLSNGFTAAAVGLNRMHQLCRDTFGSTARMCTTEELFRTPDLEDKPVREPGGSWVHPVLVAIQFDGTAENSSSAIDFTGTVFRGRGSGTCGGWQSPDPAGVGAIYAAPAGKRVVNKDACTGGFEETKPVTCCVPRGLD